MAKWIVGRLTYGNVVATLALFVALGAGAYAANQIGSKEIQNNSVSTKDIKNKKGVTGKDVKDNNLTGKDIGDGTIGASDLALDEPFHLVGGAGEPIFSSGAENDCIWVNLTAPAPVTPSDVFNPISFYKDKSGIVHLAGAAQAIAGPGGDGTCDDTQDNFVFQLPEAYRPAHAEVFGGISTGGIIEQILVNGTRDLVSPPQSIPAGTVASVSVNDGDQLVLDGITFRAASGPPVTAKASTTRAAESPVLEKLFR